MNQEMADPVEQICRMCWDSLPKKSRRSIFSETFGVFDQLIEVLGQPARLDDDGSRYVCGHCYKQLEKLAKIDHDLLHKITELRARKNNLLSLLRHRYTNIGIESKDMVMSVTPNNSISKQAISPTHMMNPRKPRILPKCGKSVRIESKAKMSSRTDLDDQYETQDTASVFTQPSDVPVHTQAPNTSRKRLSRTAPVKIKEEVLELDFRDDLSCPVSHNPPISHDPFPVAMYQHETVSDTDNNTSMVKTRKFGQTVNVNGLKVVSDPDPELGVNASTSGITKPCVDDPNIVPQ